VIVPDPLCSVFYIWWTLGEEIETNFIQLLRQSVLSGIKVKAKLFGYYRYIVAPTFFVVDSTGDNNDNNNDKNDL
jgi:hypothetical protein